MSTTLFVGDVHAVVEELDDCQALMDLIDRTVANQRVDRVVFLGDQHHNHAVVRVEVMEWWRTSLRRLYKHGLNIVMLVGNHDRPNDASSKAHSLMAYDGLARVIDEPTWIENMLLVPYMHDKEEFVRLVTKAGPSEANVLVCHQTFNGALYENGFFAPDGIDPEVLSGWGKVISGHIHTPQKFGRVEYVGAPRWRTLSDANIERSLMLYDSESDRMKLIPTGMDCKPIFSTLITPQDPYSAEKPLESRGVTHVTVRGPAQFVEEQVAVIRKNHANVRIRTIPDQRQITVRESEGIAAAMERFVGTYVGKNGTKSDVLLSMLKERL